MTILMPMFLFGQEAVIEEKVETSIGGVVSDESNNPIVGANVIVEGTDLGSAADADGYYSIELEAGSYTLTASAIGYESQSTEVRIRGDANIANFVLSVSAVEMTALEVLASRADEKTPVAHTTVDKVDLEFRLGSQDVPMALNMTPSVYATQQGGGAGDARINVRGFNQRNVAVMINGVPINDQSTTQGLHDFGVDFIQTVQQIEVFPGSSTTHFGSNAIGGAVNIILTGDYKDSISLTGDKDSNYEFMGNKTFVYDNSSLNFKIGTVNNKTISAQGGVDLSLIHI